MSYLKIHEYTIIPKETFRIIRNCSVCGNKSIFINSNKFRVNANGNRIDVWLIYQCIKCKHTFNLTILERLNKADLSPRQYKSLMENDKELAKVYGTDKSLFNRNKVEIDWSRTEYHLIKKDTQLPVTESSINFKSGDLLRINNPLGLKIRVDKIIANILNITRSKVKKQQEFGNIEIISNNSSHNIDVILLNDFESIKTIS